MKIHFFKTGLMASAFFLTLPAISQDDQKKSTGKEKGDLQQIIITRSGYKDEKTDNEIKGDKVTINGKDAKDSDVNVRLNKIRDFNALQGGPDNWNFQFKGHDQAFSLFSEDSNRAMLGVVTEANEKGARVTSISKESAAEKAGLKKNDIITKIDDQKIATSGDVSKAVRNRKPGEKTTISFLRDGKEQSISAELGKWKGIKMDAENLRLSIPSWDRVDAPSVPYIMGGAPRLGLSVQDTEDGKGVKVTDVDGDGNAGKAGIKENDIITHIDDEEVTSADKVASKVRSSRDKASLNFKVLRNNKTQNIEVKIPRKLKTANL
jgi:serine protease Do